MKKNKLILLILILLFITGCDATYEISIDNNKVSEKITILETNLAVFDKVMDTGWTIRDSFELYSNPDEFSDENYKVKSLSNDNQLGLEYKSDKLSSIRNSTFFNLCYTDTTVEELDNIVTINTGSNFECYDYYENLENIKIIFKTNHKIISTNAHEVDGNEYIWNFTKNSNKEIIVSYDSSKATKKINFVTILIIVAVISVVALLMYLIFKKNKSANEI